MKSILAVLFLFNISRLVAQENLVTIDPSELFVYSSDRKEIVTVDSLLPNVQYLGAEEVYGPFDFSTNTQLVYAKQLKFKLALGEKATIDKYSDSNLLYRQFHTARSSNSDSLVASGELKIDFLSYSRNKLLLANQFGEDSMVYDTIYTLYKTGVWSEPKDSNSFQTGTYVHNNRVGVWYTVNSEFYRRFNTPIINELAYENGTMIKYITIDLSKDEQNLKQNLVGNWYSLGLTSDDKMACSQHHCSLRFVKDSTRLNRSYFGTIDVLKLHPNNTVQIEISERCAVGMNNDDQTNKKWRILEGEIIEIDDQKFKIEYLSKNLLIITHL